MVPGHERSWFLAGFIMNEKRNLFYDFPSLIIFHLFYINFLSFPLWNKLKSIDQKLKFIIIIGILAARNRVFMCRR